MMNNLKITKENKNKIIIAVLVFIFTFSILSDWENFKAGLSGKSPVEKVVNKN
ncbi:MAG: hypothetical protein L3J34_12440 [Flavobacteriaceae bacterium]|nr:hypothetical protein [Flavobacteriaceae bacterium]